MNTKWESDKNTRKHKSQAVSLYPKGDHEAERNRQDSITKTNMKHNNKKDPQKKHRLETVIKDITGGLQYIKWYQLHPDVDQDT